MRTETLGFVSEHVDNCPGCAFGEFCDEGRRLMRMAQAICKTLVDPVPRYQRSRWKA